MREIKFRGRRKDNGEWIYGYLVVEEGFWFICDENYPNTRYPVIPETVGQYIGLKDKNGKEIYEGDIVKDKERTGYYIVKWSNGGYILQHYRYEEWWHCIHSYFVFNNRIEIIEVVGNIYENPELIKEDS